MRDSTKRQKDGKHEQYLESAVILSQRKQYSPLHTAVFDTIHPQFVQGGICFLIC